MDAQTTKSHVLVVDDEKSIRVTLKEFLEDDGFTVTTAEGIPEAMEILKGCDFDVAVIDRILSNGHSGLDLIAHINNVRPLCQTILISAYPSFESARLWLSSGSYDYLWKPVAREDICQAVKKASQIPIQQRRDMKKYNMAQF